MGSRVGEALVVLSGHGANPDHLPKALTGPIAMLAGSRGSPRSAGTAGVVEALLIKLAPVSQPTPSPSLLLRSPQRDELDLKLITGLEAQPGGVGTAHHEVAVERHLGGVAQAAARTTLGATAASTEPHALGFQHGLFEGCKPKGGFYWQKIEQSGGKVVDQCRATGDSKFQKAASCEKAGSAKPK